MDAVLVVVGAVLGFVLSLAGDWVRQRFERTRRVQERSEQAAKDILVELDLAHDAFRGAYRMDSDVDDDKLNLALERIRRLSVLLEKQDARDRMTLIAEVMGRYVGAQQFTGDTPSQIGFRAWRDGQSALWDVLHNDPVRPPSEELLGYKSSIDEDDRLYEESMRAERERRRKSRD